MKNNAEALKKGTNPELILREKLLADLYSLVQTTSIHQENNKLAIDGVKNFQHSLKQVIADQGTLELRIESAHFYFHDEKLLLRDDAKRIQANLLGYLEKRHLGGFIFTEEATRVSIPDVVLFATILNNSARQENPVEWLTGHLLVEGLLWVTPIEGADINAAYDVDQQKKKMATPGQRSPRKVYAHTLKSVQEVVKKISSREKVGIRKTVRMVQTMAEEIVLQEQPMMMAMSTIKAYDDYTFAHSVNVAILAMYIGKSIGLPKEILERLGLCGLFHDLGKIIWPHELLNKVGAFDDNDLKLVRQHSLNSARIIIRQLSASVKNKGRLILPPFEHHLKYDLTGYPKIGWKKQISLCGRILTIADVYDALTSPRVYRREAMSADRALGLMFQGSGTAFDPILLKVFINMLGIYPLGTLLMLDGGDLALVSRRPTSEDLSRPWVLLLNPSGDGNYTKETEIDLSEKNSMGIYVRKILNSMNPTAYNIQPAEFLTLPS